MNRIYRIERQAIDAAVVAILPILLILSKRRRKKCRQTG